MAPRATRLLTAAALLLALAVSAVSSAKYDSTFSKNMQFMDWCKGTSGCVQNSDGSVQLAANHNKMGAFESKSYYKYGVFRVRMKLPSGYSGGLIPCLYLMSGSGHGYKDIHDEIDLEFLGGSNPREIIMHTNLITDGQNFLEQFKFPFDPSASFHTYSIVYSPDYIMWAVDDTHVQGQPPPVPRFACQGHGFHLGRVQLEPPQVGLQPRPGGRQVPPVRLPPHLPRRPQGRQPAVRPAV